MSNFPAIVGQFQQIQKPDTYMDIVKCPSPKFAVFVKIHGRESLKALIALVINEVANLLRFETNPAMIEAAAEIIIKDWPDTKLSDLKMFKDDMIRGKIGGKLYGFDARTIVECWKDYYALREDVFAEDREARYNEEKKQFNEAFEKLSGSMPEKYKQAAKEGSDKRSLREYQANTSMRTLEGICEEYAVSYDVLLKNAKEECQERWNEASGVDFDWYLDFHLKSILAHVRKCYENLIAYTT